MKSCPLVDTTAPSAVVSILLAASARSAAVSAAGRSSAATAVLTVPLPCRSYHQKFAEQRLEVSEIRWSRRARGADGRPGGLHIGRTRGQPGSEGARDGVASLAELVIPTRTGKVMELPEMGLPLNHGV